MLQGLDSKWNVTRTPGASEGAELPLKLLLEHEIRQCVSSHEHQSKLRIRFRLNISSQELTWRWMSPVGVDLSILDLHYFVA